VGKTKRAHLGLFLVGTARKRTFDHPHAARYFQPPEIR
jgi:hypothetical protein